MPGKPPGKASRVIPDKPTKRILTMSNSVGRLPYAFYNIDNIRSECSDNDTKSPDSVTMRKKIDHKTDKPEQKTESPTRHHARLIAILSDTLLLLGLWPDAVTNAVTNGVAACLFCGVAERWHGGILAGTLYVPLSDFFTKFNGRTYPLVTDI